MDGSELTFDKKKEQTIYAIIQEIISNILKHSSATVITIQLNQRDKTYSILIEDNGIEFDSIIGRGTIVDISIPL